MKLPFVIRLDPKPHITPTAHYAGQTFAYKCEGRGVKTCASTAELAWAEWFCEVFVGSSRAELVCRLAEKDLERRVAAMALQFCRAALGPIEPTLETMASLTTRANDSLTTWVMEQQAGIASILRGPNQ